MKTIVLFSLEESTLSDIQRRIRHLGLTPLWMLVEEWALNLDILIQVAGVIVDEVDQEFSQSESLLDLEQWLLEAPNSPPRMFLMPTGNRRLDRHAHSDPWTIVHHLDEVFTNDELYALAHSRRRNYADGPIICV